MEPTAKSPTPSLTVHIEGVCRSLEDGEFGAYAVYASELPIRIAEPLPGSVQTEELAQIHALLAALELVHGLRVRSTTIYVSSSRLVDSYSQLAVWNAADWRSVDGRSVRYRNTWKDVMRLQNIFEDRRVSVSIVQKDRDDSHSMRAAWRLARHGTTLHVTCELCEKTHGRQWTNHGCEPICNQGKCSGRVLRDLATYNKHVQRRHSRMNCRRVDCSATFPASAVHERDEHEQEVHGGKVYPCPYCHKHYRSETKVARHIESPCAKAPHCSECNRFFVSPQELERHVSIVHGNSGSDSEFESREISEPVIELVSSQYEKRAHQHRKDVHVIHANERNMDWHEEDERQLHDDDDNRSSNSGSVSEDSANSISHPLYRGEMVRDTEGREWLVDGDDVYIPEGRRQEYCCG